MLAYVFPTLLGLLRSFLGPGSVGAAQRGWAPECAADSAHRRRCWARRRRRQPAVVGAGSTAVAAPAAGGLASAGVLTAPDEGCAEGMVLLVGALCALLRGCQLLESRRAAISLLYEAALACDDDTRLQRTVPYLVTQLGDTSALIRCGSDTLG